jgi:hypothetical protein
MSASNGKYPPTEVQPRATRRRFTAAYKRRIVEAAAQCAHGELGARLRCKRSIRLRPRHRPHRVEVIAGGVGQIARLPGVQVDHVEIPVTSAL